MNWGSFSASDLEFMKVNAIKKKTKIRHGSRQIILLSILMSGKSATNERA